MDAVEYLKERERMCDSMDAECGGCEFSWENARNTEYGNLVKQEQIPVCRRCTRTCMEEMLPELACGIVKAWSENNPVHSWLMEFRRLFPNSTISNWDIFDALCPYALFGENAITRNQSLATGARRCDEECERCWSMECKFKEE